MILGLFIASVSHVYAANTSSMVKISPVKGETYITQGWNNWNPQFYGANWGFRHKGIDYGTHGKHLPAISISDGKVSRAEWAGAWGNLVVIRLGDTEYYYAHLKEIKVRVGDVVEVGTEVGLIGTSGKSSGIHLHLGVKKKG